VREVSSAAGVQSALVANLLEQIPGVAERVNALLSPSVALRSRIREHLLANDALLQVAAEPDTRGLVAVDGARVQQSWFAVDFLAACAVAAPGRRVEGGMDLAVDAEIAALPRTIDTDRAASLVMSALELGVAAQVRDATVALDGALVTNYLSFFATFPHLTSAEAIELVVEATHERALAGARRITDATGPVIALSKADTGRVFAETWEQQLGEHVALSDKLLASVVLEPGEFLAPLPQLGFVNMQPRASDDDHGAFAGVDRGLRARAQQLISDLGEALRPAMRASAEQRVMSTYVKPAGSITAVKMEFITPSVEEAIPTARDLVKVVVGDTAGPHMQEPMSQYLADTLAKGVSPAITPLRARLVDHLRTAHPGDGGAESYMRWLLTDYRTPGASR